MNYCQNEQQQTWSTLPEHVKDHDEHEHTTEVKTVRSLCCYCRVTRMIGSSRMCFVVFAYRNSGSSWYFDKSLLALHQQLLLCQCDLKSARLRNMAHEHHRAEQSQCQVSPWYQVQRGQVKAWTQPVAESRPPIEPWYRPEQERPHESLQRITDD